MTYQLHHGDALAVLRELPTASVDALITDPPYSSGGMVRGDRRAAGQQESRPCRPAATSSASSLTTTTAKSRPNVWQTPNAATATTASNWR